MYVFETFLAGIHWDALERILERVWNVNGAFGTQMERVRNANGNANAKFKYEISNPFFFRKFSIFFKITESKF